MRLIMRLVYLACVASLPVLPSTWWSGWLVGSRCYSSLDNNRSDTPSYVNWDRMGAIRYCSPNYNTKEFTIVDQRGLSFKLDPSGNEKAVALLRNTAKKTLHTAAVKGEISQDSIKVNTISVAKRSGH
jgi:hypothetical protein